MRGVCGDRQTVQKENLYLENYENDSDPEKDKTYTLEECMKEWGISIEIPNDETIEAMQELENGGGTVFEGTAHDFISAMLEG